MMLKRAIYRATCDECGAMHPVSSDQRTIMNVLKKDGWSVDGDVVICPDCIKKRREHD